MATQTLWNWGPLVALGLIVTIFLATLRCAVYTHTTLTDKTFLGIWMLVTAAVVYNFFVAIYRGPGFVKLKWEAPGVDKPKDKLQYCRECNGYKAPRAHHCKECKRCCKMFDHHCPWINSCVGNDNRLAFVSFATLVPIGCTYSAYVCLWYLIQYYAEATNRRRSRRPYPKPGELPLSLRGFVFILLGAALAIGVTLGVGMLAGIQWRSILRNKTEVENWITKKAKRRERSEPFVFPYDMGWKKNVHYNRDGIDWPVVDGCTPYTFSQEQMAQKREKYASRRTFVVTKEAGRFGWRAGFRAQMGRPCFEDFVSFKVGDKVQAWQARNHWYYGEKVVERADGWHTDGRKGWFPKFILERVQTDLPYVPDEQP